MAGTGLYCVKKAPAHNDDAQSGAPTGQVVSLVTGGLGTASAWAGGYVVNQDANGVETRAIVLHVDDAVTLEGDLSNWDDGDDLDIYDAWGTIADALGQLWTDQAAAAFTASQYVRVFAGTYDENVVPNAGLNPDETGGSALIIEGDPADDLANIVVSPVGGTYTFFVNCDQCMLRHLKIAGTPTAQIVRTSTGCARLEVLDCEITGAKTGIYSLYYARVEDCSITVTVNAIAVRIGSLNYGGLISGCVIVGPGKATSTSYGIYNAGRYIGLTVEATVISGFRYGVYLVENSGVRVANSTLYDCTYGIHLPKGLDPFVWIRNTIFSVVDYPFYFITWPEESATALGPTVVQRNNVFHGYTAIGWDGAAVKTFAEWVALNLVDAAGDLNEVDPELVDPSSDDFSLEPSSPCRHAGHGSGVAYDYLGNEFHPNTPDVGAWSSEDSVSSVVWPASLPQTVDQPTFTEGFAPTVERSEMDSGPAKVRRRFTSGVQTFEATVTLTVAQAATLQAFFDTTTMGGSLSFQWTHPRTGATATMRFLEPPQLTQPGPQHFVASLALEVLP